jgi:hypothetical protein
VSHSGRRGKDEVPSQIIGKRAEPELLPRFTAAESREEERER